MRRIKYSIVLLAVCGMCVLHVNAQTAKSSYFLDGALHNYQLNPAMPAERPFFSTMLGNWSLKTNSNFGLSNFISPARSRHPRAWRTADIVRFVSYDIRLIDISV